jgi:hypothetical protein
VARVAVRCNGAEQDAVRAGTGWRLTVEGKEQPADVATLLDVVEALARARADAWVADADDGMFGVRDTSSAGPSARDTCTTRVTFAEEAGARTVGVSFATADTPDTVYGKVEGDPAVFAAPASLRAALAPWLLERHALVVDPAQVRAIEVRGRGAARVLDPRAKDDAGVPLADDLAAVLTDTVHVGPPRANEAVDGKVEITVRLTPDAGRGDVVFAALGEGTRGGKKVRYVRVPGIDATLAVPVAAVARLLAAR